MESITLDALIAQTRAALEPFGHSPSTRWQYDYAWRQFHQYASAQEQTIFSPELAERYAQEIRLFHPLIKHDTCGLCLIG